VTTSWTRRALNTAFIIVLSRKTGYFLEYEFLEYEYSSGKKDSLALSGGQAP
jgi:hypothetical protein